MSKVNDNLVLIGGISGTGKSASLRNLQNPEGVIYLNCESGKKLPFPDKFRKLTITDPYTVYDAFDQAEGVADCHTIVIDSVTYLMEMFESVHIVGAKDTMSQWMAYQQYFKNLMQQFVAKSTKNVLMTAHVANVLNESEQLLETKVPIKGALKNNGLESYFSTVVTCRKVGLRELEPYQSDLLTISPEEQSLGFKYVFQTKITQDTVNHRIRSSMGMWTQEETFIDNDAQLLLKRLREYHQP